MFTGFGVTVREDGFRGLAKGWAPTFFGYSIQGLGKFGLYEVFKVLYSGLLGEVRLTAKHRLKCETQHSYSVDVLANKAAIQELQ